MNTMGHVERFVNRPRLERGPNGLGWRPDYNVRDRVTSDIAYGQYADFGLKAGVTAMSVGLLLQADTPTEKILFGLSTAVLGLIALASAYEAF